MLSAEHVEVSRHKCLIYDGAPAEQLPVVAEAHVAQELRERDRLREVRRAAVLAPGPARGL